MYSIDYSKLTILEAKLITEIKESAEYFPGLLEDLIVTTNGMLIASDRQKMTLELFNENGKHKSTIARKGNGPGEITSNSFNLVSGANDTFIVQYGDTHKKDFYVPKSEGGYEYQRSLMPNQLSNQILEVIEWHSETEYFALKKDWKTEIGLNLPEYNYIQLVVVDESMTVLKDSLHILKTPNYIFEDSRNFSSPLHMAGLAFLGMPPYRYQDRLRKINDKSYLIGQPDDGVISIFNSKHELINQIILDIKERPVQKSDVDFMMKKNPLATNNKISEELEKYIDNVKPPFLNIWSSYNYIWLHTDTSDIGKEVVVLGQRGEPIGRLFVSKLDDIQVFKRNKIYTIHKDNESGHSIKIYRVNL